MLAPACDNGPFENASTGVGPPIQVVSNNLGSSYTLDQPIQLSFNRFLNPATVTRQAIYLEDSSGNLLTYPVISYDPVTLTVSLTNPGGGLAWLTAGQMYSVVVNPQATNDAGPGVPLGLLAIDGATLGGVYTASFTANPPPMNPYTGPPAVDFCTAIAASSNNGIFGSCAYAGCHSAGTIDAGSDAGLPRLGLDLSSNNGVLDTAVNQIADESNTGPVSQSETWNPPIPFGIDMNVINGGSPGLSWMVYKTLLNEPAPSDAGSPISDSERAILSNYILGQGMPFPQPLTPEPASADAATYTGTLTEGQLETLSQWIAQGAPVPSSCP